MLPIIRKRISRASLLQQMQRAFSTRVIGIQSGNAVDGIDVGIFDFEEPTSSAEDPRLVNTPIAYKTLANKTYPYNEEEREFVLSLRRMRLEDGNDYAIGNYTMGRWFATRVMDLLEETGIPKESIDLIGSHGQTVSGHPHWEFGDLSVISQLTGITTIGDFRTADVAQGGNGTPCTCTYDSIMLRPPPGTDKWRVAINIGGTSSVSFLPPQGDPAVPSGLDPGLGVFFMDLTVRQIDPSLEYDDDGKMARSGKVHEGLLDEFLQNKYYQKKELPIGVGPDDFPETLYHEWRARAQELGVSDIDLLTTLTELTCKQIALACKRFGGDNIVGATDDVIMRGGVANNSFFMERMEAQMSEHLGTDCKVNTLDTIGLDEDSWENCLYALLGYLNYKGKYNFVPSCTGASKSVVGGKVAPGDNFEELYAKRFK